MKELDAQVGASTRCHEELPRRSGTKDLGPRRHQHHRVSVACGGLSSSTSDCDDATTSFLRLFHSLSVSSPHFHVMDTCKQASHKVSEALSLPPKWLGQYSEFITKNASAVSQIESALRSLTYIIPGSHSIIATLMRTHC